MTNPNFQGDAEQTSPATDIIPITPDDSSDLVPHARAIICQGNAGNVVLVTRDGEADRTVPIAANQQLDVYVRRVKATGTTATGLFALI